MSATPVPQARDQVGRLLTLVPYLHARGTVHVDEAARDLGTTPKQLVKDLKVLLMCGLPGGYPDDLIDVDLDALEEDGDGVIRVSNADYLARPLRLTPTEASAAATVVGSRPPARITSWPLSISTAASDQFQALPLPPPAVGLSSSSRVPG